MKKAMKGFFMAADAVQVPRGAISHMVQKRVEASVGNRPLSHGETRGIDIPNHFISTVPRHHNRDHVASTMVNGVTMFIHEVPHGDTPAERVWIPQKPDGNVFDEISLI